MLSRSHRGARVFVLAAVLGTLAFIYGRQAESQCEHISSFGQECCAGTENEYYETWDRCYNCIDNTDRIYCSYLGSTI